MRDARTLVEFEIHRMPPGRPFFIQELRYVCSTTTARQALDHFRALGLVLFVDSDLYARPLRGDGGTVLLPHVIDVLDAVKRVDGCVVWPLKEGQRMARRSSALTFWTTGRSRTIHLGTQIIKLRKETDTLRRTSITSYW